MEPLNRTENEGNFDSSSESDGNAVGIDGTRADSLKINDQYRTDVDELWHDSPHLPIQNASRDSIISSRTALNTAPRNHSGAGGLISHQPLTTSDNQYLLAQKPSQYLAVGENSDDFPSLALKQRQFIDSEGVDGHQGPSSAPQLALNSLAPATVRARSRLNAAMVNDGGGELYGNSSSEGGNVSFKRPLKQRSRESSLTVEESHGDEEVEEEVEENDNGEGDLEDDEEDEKDEDDEKEHLNETEKPSKQNRRQAASQRSGKRSTRTTKSASSSFDMAKRTKRRTLLDIITQEEIATKALEVSPRPSGIEHFIMNDEGEYFDPRLDSQEDLRRRCCKRVTDLDVLGPRGDEKRPHCQTEIFPPFKDPAKLFSQGAQFWLTSAVTACRDYDTTAKMLRSGSIQAAMHSFRGLESMLDRMLLITLLRLAASCANSGQYLAHAADDIYMFLHDVLHQPNEHLYKPVKKRFISDSRAYECYLILALAAHTRPLLTSTNSLNFRREVLYQNHAHLMFRAYGKLASSNPDQFIQNLPPHLAAYNQTLTMHDMAVEIFVDVAKYGLFAHFATSVMNARWARLLSLTLRKRQFDIVTIQLCQVLHQAPQAVLGRLESPYIYHKKCWDYLYWAIDSIMDDAFFKPEGKAVQNVPVQFAAACSKALISMLKSAEILPRSEGFLDTMHQEAMPWKLVMYVLAVPFCELNLREDDNKELYESTWSLIHALSYTFPMMGSTLLDYACDEETPLSLAGHAAMFVGSLIAFAKYEVTREQATKVHAVLRKYAEAAPSVNVRNLRLELAFRLGVLLQAEKYDTKENAQAKAAVAEEASTASLTVFAPYTFKPANPSSAPCSGNPPFSHQSVDAEALLVSGRINNVARRPDFVVEDNFHPSWRYGLPRTELASPSPHIPSERLTEADEEDFDYPTAVNDNGGEWDQEES